MRHVSRGQWRTMVCWPAVWKIISRSNYINVSISDCLRGVRQLPFRIPGILLTYFGYIRFSYMRIKFFFSFYAFINILSFSIFETTKGIIHRSKRE